MGASTDNKNLHRAKVVKDDEFYTPYDYVKEELDHYDFTGLRVSCPFDKESSAFVKYFTELVRADRCRSLDFSHIDDEVITRVYPDLLSLYPLRIRAIFSERLRGIGRRIISSSLILLLAS